MRVSSSDCCSLGNFLTMARMQLKNSSNVWGMLNATPPTAMPRMRGWMYLSNSSACKSVDDVKQQLRFGAGRQRMALERCTNPKLSRRT